ncbi:MAG: tetratricopeptide repeat protein [Roseiflexaceae bacterium]|nr:tetratricopeptide repeat protein [Roseiflexaceae bacterium]
MSGMLALLLLVPLLLGIAAVGLLRADLLTRFAQRWRGVRPGTPATGETIVQRKQILPIGRGSQAGPLDNSQLRLALVGLAAAIVFVFVIGRVMAPPSVDDFVVLVVPFQESGAVTQTGRVAADRLVSLLPQATAGRVRVMRIDAPPADATAAQALLVQYSADALVWGTIAPGGMLDAETLTPQLAYRPTGTYTPHAWAGYTGRFALPLTYRLSNAPINGAVVLPPLLHALADYADDQPDSAQAALTRLTADYPALAPTLPNMLIGNMLWARGEMSGAADAYRRAIAGADTTGKPPQAALLYNNLGAILQDAGDLAARDAFNQAITLLNANGSDLGELRLNLAYAARAAGDQAGMLAALEQARPMLPPSASLLLDLSAARRMNSRLSSADGPTVEPGNAQVPLTNIERQVIKDIDLVPIDLRQYESDRLHAQVAYQQALTQLTALTELRGPLLWALEARNDLDQRTLNTISSGLDQASQLSQERMRDWSTRAAAQDAAGHQVAGQIATQQARYAEIELRAAQRWQAVVAIEMGESQNVLPPQGITAAWSSLTRESSSLGEAKRMLEELITLQPGDADLLLLLGQDLLARGDLEQAVARFNAADSLSPNRPEPLYGLALVQLADQKVDEQQRRNDARTQLNRSLERDPAFYPARIQLATIAEVEGDWATALLQRRQLVDEQPSDATRLALAQTLHRSGSSGFAEAEALLLPIANANNIAGLVELSQLYRDYGNSAAQQEVLERAQRLAPRNVAVAYDLGELLRKRGERVEAEHQYQTALSTDRTHIPSLLAIAGLYDDRPEQAADFYRRALDAGANDVPTLKRIGERMLTAKQYDLALLAFERAVKNSPQDAEAQHGVARANLRLGRLEGAQSAAQQALDLRGGNYAEALIDLGDIALARNQPDEARDRYNAAIQNNPSLLDAYVGLGRAVASKGDWAVAVGHFRNAVAVKPDSPDAHLWLGEALIRNRDPAAALDQYQQALKLRESSYPEALFGAAQAQIALGQFDAAEANLDTALKERPDYAEALLLQGKLYEQTNRDRKALKAYEAAIDANRQIAEPHYRRALLLIQDNQLDVARGELDTALQIQAIFPEANYWRGRIEFAQARYREALDRFSLAVQQANGNYPEARLYQGLAEERLGLRDAAIASFRATLDQGENSAWVGEARAALSRLGAQ